MKSVTGEGASRGRATQRAGERPGARCRWCGGPAAWTWTMDGAPWTLRGDGRADEGCPVCTDCQALTLAGDDAAVLDRHLAELTARVAYPVAVDFLREQGAERLARWIGGRESFRALDRGALR